MDQVRGLRSRALVERMSSASRSSRGALLRIGNTSERILAEAGRVDLLGAFPGKWLTEERVQQLAQMGTTLTRIGDVDFDSLVRHGYEVADCTLHAYNPDLFAFLGPGEQVQQQAHLASPEPARAPLHYLRLPAD